MKKISVDLFRAALYMLMSVQYTDELLHCHLLQFRYYDKSSVRTPIGTCQGIRQSLTTNKSTRYLRNFARKQKNNWNQLKFMSKIILAKNIGLGCKGLSRTDSQITVFWHADRLTNRQINRQTTYRLTEGQADERTEWRTEGQTDRWID